MIVVSIFCYLIKHQAKRKNLLSFHVKNNELKEIMKLCIIKYKSKMSNKFKDIRIKNHTYYFFDDIINVKVFGRNNMKIDEKL